MYVCVWLYVLGPFSKLRQVTVSFGMFVRLSAWYNSAPSRSIFMKFGIWVFVENLSQKFELYLKSDWNNEYITWRPMYISDHISLIAS
jgi:hypothetical protein